MRRSPEPAHPPQHSPQSQPAAALPAHDPCPEHSSCKRPHRCRCGPSYLTRLVLTQPECPGVLLPTSVGGFLILGWPLLPLLKALGHDLHGCDRRLVEAGITANFPPDARTLIAQHLAHVFQVANDPANFRH